MTKGLIRPFAPKKFLHSKAYRSAVSLCVTPWPRGCAYQLMVSPEAPLPALHRLAMRMARGLLPILDEVLARSMNKITM